MIDKIRNIVKAECDNGDWYDWKYHVAIVLRYSLELAEKYDADKDVVELAALTI